MLIAISIIVPCCNQAQYLSETLDSVLSQTYEDWECIIVNDGSTDDTETVSKKYTEKDSRFIYLHKENGGLSSARNAGIKLSSGKYILPLDSDDIIDKNYITLAIDAFSTQNNPAIVYCKATKFGYENHEWVLEPYSFKNLLIENCIFCSAIYPKELWEKSAGYDEGLKSGWEDWDFWLSILDPECVVYQIPQTLFFYRTKEVSMVRVMTISDIEQINWFVFNKHIQKYRETFQSPITQIKVNRYFQKHVADILSSNSYKLGNSLLSPLSFIKRFLKYK